MKHNTPKRILRKFLTKRDKSLLNSKSDQQQQHVHNTTGTIEEAYSKAHLNHKLKTHSTEKQYDSIARTMIIIHRNTRTKPFFLSFMHERWTDQAVAIGPNLTVNSMAFMASNLGSLAWNFRPA